MIVYALNLAIIGLIVYTVRRRYKSTDLIKYFFPALILKLVAGVGVGLLYYYHYGYGDTIGYQLDAIRLSDLFMNNISGYIDVLFGWSADISQFTYANQPRAFFLVKILSIVHLLTGQNYWLSGAYFSLFSFVGFWALTNTLVKHYPVNKFGIIIALLFFPSVIFWSAGIIKESIAIGAMMLLIKFLVDWLFKRNLDWKRILLSGILLFLIWQLKYYYLGVFSMVTIPLILAVIIARSDYIKINTYIVYGLLLIFLAGMVSLMHPNFHLTNILQVIVDNHDIYVANSRSEQIIHYGDLRPTLFSMIYYFPLAVWSGLFRMAIWEANQLMEYLIGLENVLILIFTISAMTQLSKIGDGKNKLLVISAILYVILLAGFLALSAPNLGTLARYKIGFLPVMILLILSNNPLLSLLKAKFSAKVEDNS